VRGLRFGDIALLGRRAVRVDVADRREHAGVVQRHAHGLRHRSGWACVTHAIAVGAIANDLGQDRAPRCRACSSSSSTSVQAPSPSTSPSRAASNGRGVACGASLRVLVANSVSKTAASVASSSSAPPATIAT
jgi:hypothetical protein